MCVVFVLCILIFHDSLYFVTRRDWQLDNKRFIIILLLLLLLDNDDSVSVLTAISPGRTGLAGARMSPFWILLKQRMMDVVSGDNWSYKSCKAPVKSSPSTNEHPALYRLDALPVAQLTLSKH